MGTKLKLPIGVEFFKNFKAENFYYVDKTGFIRELIESRGSVNLFTRPRRFGKSLNMDMLRTFFEIGTDTALFEGLEITGDNELCEQYMGKYPVISISLKDVSGMSYASALKRLSGAIKKEARRHQYLLKSDKLSEVDKESLKPLFGPYIDDAVQEESIYLLSEMLFKHYGRQVIILIDEYDVPLDKAYQKKYYPEMAEHIRAMFSEALKTNENLYFAVITGCLRIARESIFTGLNNFKVRTLSDIDYAEYFGFTDAEVRQTYLWSVLFATGYLTALGRTESGHYKLVIPNREVRGIYEKKIRSWFKVRITSNMPRWQKFCEAVKNGNAGELQNLLNQFMSDSISIRDTYVKNDMKENYYHGMLLGLLQAEGSWIIQSNAESVIGYTDIKLEIPSEKIGCVIEVKYAENGKFDAACRKAMKQIDDGGYSEALKKDGIQTIHKYGIACYKKSCKVAYSSQYAAPLL